MTGIVYCRVSSDEQVKGTSLESQESACREYARSHSIKVVQVFVERGESAKFADRTALLELLDFCRQNKGAAEVLLVWKIDRFARNVSDHFSIKATLAKYGVRIVSVTEPIDANPEGKLMETILAGFAQFDNDIRAMRTVQGMRRKIQEGIFPWKPPLGYKSANPLGEKKTEPDQPAQPLFALLQKAWKQFTSGAYTKADIRRLMTNWGITTRKGKPLSGQMIDELFRNSYYAAVLTDPWTGEEFEGKHVPMVSREEFARVQQIVAGRNHSVPHRRQRPEFPLRGLVRCHRCHRYLTGSFSRGRSNRYAYYHCTKEGCERRSYAVKDMHRDFGRFLESIAPKPELVGKLGNYVLQALDSRQGTVRMQQARRDTELGRIKKQMQELIRMRAESLITDQEFLEQKKPLIARRVAIEGSQIEEVGSPHLIRQQLSEITGPVTCLHHTWETLDLPYRRRFERLLLPVGFVNGKARTAELGLLFQAFQSFSEPKPNGVAPTWHSWNRVLLEIREFWQLLREALGPREGSKGPVRRIAVE